MTIAEKILKSKIPHGCINLKPFQETPVILECMEEYFEIRLKKMMPSENEIEANAKGGGLRDGELQMFWEGGTWLRNFLLRKL